MRHHQVQTPVCIVIREGARALISVNRNPRFLPLHRGKIRLSKPTQPQPAAGIEPIIAGRKRGIVLRQKKVVDAVSIEIAHCHAKCRSQLRLRVERLSLEALFSV